MYPQNGNSAIGMACGEKQARGLSATQQIQSPPATMPTTSSLSADCSRISEALFNRLVTLRAFLNGEPQGTEGPVTPSPSAINDHLNSATYSLRAAHDLVAEIASSLGYEV